MRVLVRAVPLATLLAFGAVLLGGCGSGKIFIPNSAAEHCPSQPAGQFDRADFAAHVGLAIGSFHRWVWQPYHREALHRPGEDRHANRVKAADATVLAAQEMRRAVRDVRMEPEICGQMYAPVSDLANALDKLAHALRHGDMETVDRSVESMHGAMVELRTLAGKNGVRVTGRHR